MWPNFGNVKKTAAVGLSLLGLHHLYVQFPGWKLSTGDGIPQVLSMKIGIGSSHTGPLLLRKMGNALRRPEVEFAVAESAISRHHLEGMDTKARHPPDRIRDAARTKEVHQCVDAFRLVYMKIPKLNN